VNQTQRAPVTITELATRTGMHRNTIVRDIGDGVGGILPARRVGGQWEIDPDDADEYAAARSMVLCGEKALAGLRQKSQERIAKRGQRGR